MDYRERITEEAAKLFLKYGIKAVSMDMLANQMGISKRTIYEVFSDKDELIAGVLKLMAVKQKELVEKLFCESENVIEAIFKLFEIMSEHLSKMNPVFSLDMKKYHAGLLSKLQETNEMPFVRTNAEMIARGIREGVFRENIDVEITNKCLYEVMRMSDDRDIYNQGDFDKKHVFRDFYINYLRGISTPKGLDLINYYEKILIH